VDHDDGARCVPDHMLRDRAEEHARERAVTVAAYDEEIRAPCGSQQDRGGVGPPRRLAPPESRECLRACRRSLRRERVSRRPPGRSRPGTGEPSRCRSRPPRSSRPRNVAPVRRAWRADHLRAWSDGSEPIDTDNDESLVLLLSFAHLACLPAAESFLMFYPRWWPRRQAEGPEVSETTSTSTSSPVRDEAFRPSPG
jgi:hypothetical protein